MKRRTRLIRFVAQTALARLNELPPSDRADLLEGLSLVMSGKESAIARHTAALIRQAETHQLQFVALLNANTKKGEQP